ncbi:MAG: hypothetical protein IJ740_13715, partial [Ruminococcus sp.]|nr:hypothetical protein [Ruminococcus sp.]
MTFAFDFELTEPTISINDGQTVIQTGGKPIVTAESGEYISGEFSAAITQISVTGYAYSLTDDTALYHRALSFFDNSDFLIKLPGRGCIVAGITNKSLRRNDNGATILNFSFTQIKDTG